MRRLTLLLCLLMVAALRWIIGSPEVLTITEQNKVVLPKPEVTLKAVNTGLRATWLRPALARKMLLRLSTSCCGQRLMLVCTQPSAILSRSNRRVEFEFIEIAAGKMIEISLPPRIGLMALDKSICNLA